MVMKALQSAFAKAILQDPDSARALREALGRAGYGPQNGVAITVRPVQPDGTRADPVPVNVHYAYKPQERKA